MSNLVYIVTEGCYSDYGIVAVFSTRAAAEGFVTDYQGDHEYEDGPRVEIYVLDGGEPDDDMIWNVTMTEKGDLAKARRTEDGSPDGEPHFDGPWSWTTAYGPANIRYFFWSGWARTEEQAIKAANEARTQRIALSAC